MTSTASTTSVDSMTSTALFHQKAFDLKKNIYFWWFVTFYCLKKTPKSQNNSKFIKEQEVLSNWTIEGAQHQKNEKIWIWHKSAFLTNPKDPKYQQKSKAISSAEPNYFVHFAMRHPVLMQALIWSKVKISSLSFFVIRCAL